MNAKLYYLANAFLFLITLPPFVLAFLLSRLVPNLSLERVAARVTNKTILWGALIAHCCALIGYTIAFGWPEPYGDDFSFLLMAKTFLQGRLTNPTPLPYEHYDTFHVLIQPTYTSKFPFGQGIVLALGYLLSGKFIVGNWIVSSLNLFLLFKICRILFSRFWTSVTLFITILHSSIFLANTTYWCISLVLTPCLLLILVYLKLDNKTIKPGMAGFLVAVSLFLITLTRPFEGIVTLVLIFLFLVIYKKINIFSRSLIFSFLGTSAILLSSHLIYNKSVTGNLLKMPYILHTEQYQESPILLFQKPRELTHSSQTISDKYAAEMEMHNRPKTAKIIFFDGFYRLMQVSKILQANFILLIGFIVFLFAKRKQQSDASLRIFLGPLLLSGFLCSALNNFADDHYTAFLWPLFVLMGVAGYSQIARKTSATLLCVALTTVLNFCFGVYLNVFNDYDMKKEMKLKREVSEKFRGQKTVFMVQYAGSHRPTNEWVYNDPIPIESEHVFVRDLPHNSEEMIDQYLQKGFKFVHIYSQGTDKVPIITEMKNPKQKIPEHAPE